MFKLPAATKRRLFSNDLRKIKYGQLKDPREIGEFTKDFSILRLFFLPKCSFWHNCIVIQKNTKWTPPVASYDSFLGNAINYDRHKYYFVIIFCLVPTHLPVDSRTVPRRTFLRRTLLRPGTSLTGHIPTDI